MISETALLNHAVKNYVRFAAKCPICGQNIHFGVEQPFIDQVQNFPFPHVVLHGTPLHVLVAYIDKDMQVRGLESAQSVEILREGATFSQIIQKWSNPF